MNKPDTLLSGFFYNSITGGFVRYPNLRYGNPTEMAYYAMGRPIRDLARSLRRDPRTVKDWLSGRQRVPWWVPEILRLRRMELDLRQRQMGMGALAPRLGMVSADVIQLARHGSAAAGPVGEPARQHEHDDDSGGVLLHASLARTSSL
jgi:hypothetical protein